MSLEAWGDEGDGGDYDHLLDAGWWTSEQVDEVTGAIKALIAEPVYHDGKKENGVSVRFIMRLTVLQNAAGLLADNDPLVVEALAALGGTHWMPLPAPPAAQEKP